MFLAQVSYSQNDSIVSTMGLSEPFALIELFTSEGCGSCPPADQIFTSITQFAQKENKRIFTLGFHVDYWDYLGWRDVRFFKTEENKNKSSNLELRMPADLNRNNGAIIVYIQDMENMNILTAEMLSLIDKHT